MKYMGSKRAMLQNGLGDILCAEMESASRLVDLFCGGGAVSWFAATRFNKPVLAVDLQEYAAVLADAVVARICPASADEIEQKWLISAMEEREAFPLWNQANELDRRGYNTATWRKKAQELCANASGGGLIWRAYGGHYFSPTQALTFDAMLNVLPVDDAARRLCLAVAIISASRCAASPGHTAQPFKATRTAGRYLREAWNREPITYARRDLERLCPLYARHKGQSLVCDANTAAKQLNPTDVVFVDPPYSGVHYSRFYHVLETMARGQCGEVQGVGRYPPATERPLSRYSMKTEAQPAMRDLLQSLSDTGCRAVVTFPNDRCSNGLSGPDLEHMARSYFKVTRRKVKTRFSTLGGNCRQRGARKVADELILVLKPL